MIIRHSLGAVIFGLFAISQPAPALAQFSGETVRVQTWGGTDGEGVRKNILDPYTRATGAKVVVEEGVTSAGIAKVLAQKNDPQIDVLMFDDVGVDALWREGLLEKLDLKKLPNAKDIPERFILDDNHGISWGVYTVTLIYNSKLTDPPKSWADLWDPKYKGKILLPRINGTQTLFLTLMAAKLNGGDLNNLDKGWPAVTQLANNAHSWIENRALAAELLRTGEALVAVDVTNMYKDFVDKGYPLAFAYDLKEGIFPYSAAVALVKNSKANRDAAYDLINRALSADAQSGVAKMVWWAPTNSKAKIDDKDKNFIMHTPEQWSRAVDFDRQQLVTLRPSIIDKWNAIVSTRK